MATQHFEETLQGVPLLPGEGAQHRRMPSDGLTIIHSSPDTPIVEEWGFRQDPDPPLLPFPLGIGALAITS